MGSDRWHDVSSPRPLKIMLHTARRRKDLMSWADLAMPGDARKHAMGCPNGYQ